MSFLNYSSKQLTILCITFSIKKLVLVHICALVKTSNKNIFLVRWNFGLFFITLECLL